MAKEEQSEGQLPEKGVHNFRQRKRVVSPVGKVESDAAWSDAPARLKTIMISKKVRGENKGKSGEILVGLDEVRYEGSWLNVGNTMESSAFGDNVCKISRISGLFGHGTGVSGLSFLLSLQCLYHLVAARPKLRLHFFRVHSSRYLFFEPYHVLEIPLRVGASTRNG